MTQNERSEVNLLQEARKKGALSTTWAYLRLSGPGFLQSSISLGGGSLASSLFLGVLGGLAMLWVQPLAMLMGVIMLSAITYVTLATERSPFDAIRREINPVLAWGWLGASLMANVVWALPQYALAYGAITENLFSGYFSAHLAEDVPRKDVFSVKLGVSLVILLVVAAMSLPHGKERIGLKIYEWILKGMVAVIVLSFMGVVFQLIRYNQFDWLGVLKGLVPNLDNLFHPNEGIRVHINAIEDIQARSFWDNLVLQKQREIMIGAAAAAVGINMTFLMPYSLLGKKWNKSMQPFAVFDLIAGFLIPFILATGCVVIASASQFHGQALDGLVVDGDGDYSMTEPEGQSMMPEIDKLIQQRQAVHPNVTLEAGEVSLASMLVNRDNVGLATALEKLFGNPFFSQKIFGLGVLAVALSSASLMMIISGFCICEATGAPHGGWVHRLGMFCGATGAFWPFLWSGTSKAYLAVVASTVGFIFLPIAYLAFFLMMNSKRILGNNRPTGLSRIIWNVLILISLLTMGLASAWSSWNKVLFGFSVGKFLWGLFIFLFVAGAIYKHQARKGGTR